MGGKKTSKTPLGSKKSAKGKSQKKGDAVDNATKSEIHEAHKGGVSITALSAKHGLPVDRIKAILVDASVQDFIAAMGALRRLDQRAVNEVKPLVKKLAAALRSVAADCPGGQAKFCPGGQAALKQWLVALEGMRAEEEINEEELSILDAVDGEFHSRLKRWRTARVQSKEELKKKNARKELGGDGDDRQIQINGIKEVVGKSPAQDFKKLWYEIRTKVPGLEVKPVKPEGIYYCCELRHDWRLTLAEAKGKGHPQTIILYYFKSNHKEKGENKKRYDEILKHLDRYRLPKAPAGFHWVYSKGWWWLF